MEPCSVLLGLGLGKGSWSLSFPVQWLKSASEGSVATTPSGYRQMWPNVATQALSDLALSGSGFPVS